MTVIIEDPGPLALLQDAGRPGLGHLGVTRSGAFDRSAMRQANTILGNRSGAVVIEALGGGLVIRAEADVVIAVTGGDTAITLDAHPAAYGRALRVQAGQRLTLDTPATGLRAYVAVAGGFWAAEELGSGSTDTLAGLGPAPLRAGDRIATGTAARLPHLEDVPALGRSGDLTMRVILGPRDDWFAPTAVRLLMESPWQVSSASNRVGIRLAGAPLARARSGELPSEPCLRGSIQVAADGQPIIFGPDHPVTGGYPVIAVVVDADTDALAQARPGQMVRFSTWQ